MQATKPDKLPVIRTQKKRRSDAKINLAEAVKNTFINGLTESEEARRQGVTRQSINQALIPFKTLLKDAQVLDVYNENKDAILTSCEMTLLMDMMDKGKRDKASLNNTAYAQFGIANQVRLGRDQSTSNVSLHGIVDALLKDSQDISKMKETILKSMDQPVANESE